MRAGGNVAGLCRPVRSRYVLALRGVLLSPVLLSTIAVSVSGMLWDWGGRLLHSELHNGWLRVRSIRVVPNLLSGELLGGRIRMQ